MKLYCPTCGAASDYSLKKPEFCGSCGETFTAFGKFPAKRVIRPNPINPTQMIQEIEEEEEFVPPNMDGLAFALDGEREMNDRVNKLENIVGTTRGLKDDGYVRKGPTYSSDSIAEDFMKDAGSSPKAHGKT